MYNNTLSYPSSPPNAGGGSKYMNVNSVSTNYGNRTMSADMSVNMKSYHTNTNNMRNNINTNSRSNISINNNASSHIGNSVNVNGDGNDKSDQQYYTKVINHEFRNLQLDPELASKSLFDLIDYCELLYEDSATAFSSGDHHSGLKNYIKGYLIFNYFINSFIMLHFKGFDAFVESNEQDFIIYLNVFAFYNADDIIRNSSHTVSSATLRGYIKKYLVDSNLLSFNVEELYDWLHEYIKYLKEKDRSMVEINVSSGDEIRSDGDLFIETATSSSTRQTSNGNSSIAKSKKTYSLNPLLNPELNSSEDFITVADKSQDTYGNDTRQDYKDNYNQHNQEKEILSPSDSVSEFKHRFPSLNGKNDTSLFTSKKLPPPSPPIIPPPIPKNLPPSLLPPNSPPPPPPPHSAANTLIPNRASTFPESPTASAPYPPGEIISRSPIPSPTSRVLRSSVAPELANDTDEWYFSNSQKPSTNANINSSHTNPQMNSTNISHRPPQTIPIARPVTSPTNVNVHYNNHELHQQIGNSHYMNNNNVFHNGQHSNNPFPSYPQSQDVGQQGSQQVAIGYYDNNGSRNVQHFGPPRSSVPQHVQIQQYQIKTQKQQYMQEFSVCGLRNFGSSCYINSTIQLIFGVSLFKSLFINSAYQGYVKDPKFLRLISSSKLNSHHKDSILLSEAISALLRTFSQHGSVSIAPTKFIRVMSLLKPDFNIPYEQQDAQEFLLFVLERLHLELSNKSIETNYELEDYIRKWDINVNMKDRNEYLKWYLSLVKSEGTSPVHDIFQGHLQNKLTCNSCGYESISYSPFTILSLPIPSSHSSKNVVNLADCLRYYSQDEVLSGENAWNCPKCSKNGVQISASSVLDNHPVFVNKKSGIFKLGRRSKSPSSQTSTKTTTSSVHSNISTKSLNFIKLPQILIIQLSRFSVFNLTDKLDTYIQYPLKLKFNNDGHEIVYKLSGLINHFGNLKSGHYTAIVNKSTVNQNLGSNLDNLKVPYWCLFDDENVKVNLPHGSITQSGMGAINSKDVYVLCYERV